MSSKSNFVLIPGSNNEVTIARDILIRTGEHFTEISPDQSFAGLSNETPLLLIDGRLYYGLDAIKRATSELYWK